MPKLWKETIAAHRQEVREAIMDTAAAVVVKEGLRSVTMSQIAQSTGIGRATLYKYFPDVEGILRAWHERQISHHLEYLASVRDKASGPVKRLAAVLEAYALVSREFRGHDAELTTFLHRDGQVVQAEQQLHAMIQALIMEAAGAAELRGDIAADELASYCLHALAAAGSLHSKAAVDRLLTVILSGLDARTE